MARGYSSIFTSSIILKYMIPKVTLKQLYDDVFKRSTLISIPQIADLLEVPGSTYSKWEIFSSIVSDSLIDYEYHFPLQLTQKVYLEVDSLTRRAEITGNFRAYVDGKITEDQVVIVPAAIAALSTSFYTASTYPLRNFRYEPPYITDCWYATGIYYMNSICKRPFIHDFDPVTKEPTDKNAVYYVNYMADTQYKILYDQIYLSLAEYILNIKKNMNLSNMPMELFQGLEEDVQDLRGKIENIYNNSMPSGYWIM